MRDCSKCGNPHSCKQRRGPAVCDRCQAAKNSPEARRKRAERDRRKRILLNDPRRTMVSRATIGLVEAAENLEQKLNSLDGTHAAQEAAAYALRSYEHRVAKLRKSVILALVASRKET